MTNYILRRLFLMIPTLIGIITITFIISEYVPGGPLDQVKAMLEGRGSHFQAAGELAVPTAGDPKKKKHDPKLEARLKRVYGLNHSTPTRLARMFIWFGKDSLLSSEEIDENTAEVVQSGKDKYLLVRLDGQYYAYPNYLIVNGKPGELVYDPARRQLISIADNAHYNVITGLPQDHGSKPLQAIPLELKNAKGRIDIYIKEAPWEAFTNYNNWHGFFLFKFGNSLVYNKTVVELIKERLPISMSLGVFSFFAVYLICIILGIAKAVRNGARFDTVTSFIILLGYSIPGFVLAVLLVVYFGPGEGHILNIVPLDGGLTSIGTAGYESWSIGKKALDYFHHLWAPTVCLSLGSFAVLTILTKNSILEHMHQLYALAARARGLSEKKVLYKHVLRNSLIPLITGFPSGFLAMFFTGSLLIEKIFGLNGLGLLGYTSVIERDFPVVMSSLFIFTILGLLGQLLTDISYVIVDPRISFEGSRG
ncbi:MAG: ABC transporter permease subunit [Candidatus Margulisiibacteriota bacterium]